MGCRVGPEEGSARHNWPVPTDHHGAATEGHLYGTAQLPGPDHGALQPCKWQCSDHWVSGPWALRGDGGVGFSQGPVQRACPISQVSGRMGSFSGFMPAGGSQPLQMACGTRSSVHKSRSVGCLAPEAHQPLCGWATQRGEPLPAGAGVTAVAAPPFCRRPGRLS